MLLYVAITLVYIGSHADCMFGECLLGWSYFVQHEQHFHVVISTPPSCSLSLSVFIHGSHMIVLFHGTSRTSAGRETKGGRQKKGGKLGSREQGKATSKGKQLLGSEPWER